ncbi:MAG: TIR domain-containing protein [Magnetospirillum sp.]
MTDKLRNAFISHIFEDNPVLSDLKMLVKTKGYQVRDASISERNRNNANDENYIKYEILAPRIKWSSVLLVLISPETHKSEYVNWEIEYAASIGKRIVGVWCHGARDADLPSALEDYAHAVVGWQSEQIIDAIEGSLNTWEKLDGQERPKQPIDRIICQ